MQFNRSWDLEGTKSDQLGKKKLLYWRQPFLYNKMIGIIENREEINDDCNDYLPHWQLVQVSPSKLPRPVFSLHGFFQEEKN